VIEELMARISVLEGVIAALTQENAALKARIVELEAKLKINSQNSSKPPSTDPPWAKSKPKSKEGEKNKRGAQIGHRGLHRDLLPVEQVDAVVVCEPANLCFCGGKVLIDGSTPEKKQVSEIPPIKPFVTEFQIFTGRCNTCSTKHRGSLPIGTPAGMLGPRAFAMIGMLSGKFKQSKRDTQELLETFFGLSVCVGTVCNAEQQVSEALALPHQELARAIQKEPVVHSDETGHNVASKRAWMWIALCKAYAVFFARAHRSKVVAQEILGSEFSGVLVSDRYNAYGSFRQRQLCWAHLVRDWVKIKEGTGESSELATKMLDYIAQMFVLWHGFKDGELTRVELQEDMEPIRHQMQTLMRKGLAMPIAGKLCKELLFKHIDSLWRFVESEGVEPTNNDAERTVRQYVIWRKTSFGTQGERGNRFVERIQTAVATCKRQNRSTLDYLVDAVTAYLHQLPAPSLLPQTV
jgi:hypothetical protein